MADSLFSYLILDAVLLSYTCYSWYWQASIDLKGHYRISSIIWSIVIIWIGFSWELIEKGDTGLSLFLAIFLIIGIIDGATGLAPKRAVVSGYFRRTIAYSDVAMVTLIKVPNPKKKTVICILTTNKHRQYYLRFSKSVTQIVETLKERIHHNVRIEVQDIL
ncbi:hypothetical protein OZY43_00655 [Lactobacillus sp. ESL0785]|uniref:hypothetical protein n=1 Tax=Lactobacillus sp. ESL0785 TaxID=2983232 RepID=UPI0023F7BC58|nr:hypothetical protein [Lactobacillus sp. ESL0785]WEV70981.1 hypothetical protein OZY43_00655 [Lactobacillus sp. ESL0785]